VYHYTRDASIQAPRVVECIPEYLEYLDIHNCGRNIISQLEEFLDPLIYPYRFPNTIGQVHLQCELGERRRDKEPCYE
jgi:hypothetical protein